MTNRIYINIKGLVGVSENDNLLRGKDLDKLGILENAFLKTSEDKIEDYGVMSEINVQGLPTDVEIIDVTGQFILPCWVDSHTHLIHATSREEEFIAKLKGATYEEIAAMGGGILNSAKRIEAISEEDLLAVSIVKLKTAISTGTGAIEIKSGYGLSADAELKMLRVIKELKRTSPIPIKATFLGAHTYPLVYRKNHQAYIDLIKSEMLPVIAKESLADYVDVFCENGFFSPKETIEICQAAAEYNLSPKLHINQLNSIGGVEAGIKVGALSLDHLETLTAADVALLGESTSISTLLPSAAFFLRMQYPPARDLINANAAISIASDFNPGSSPSSNMNFVAALSAIQMKMLPNEVINAGTINAAHALELQSVVGNIKKGKKANFYVTKPVNSIGYLFYDFAGNHISSVYVNGEKIKE